MDQPMWVRLLMTIWPEKGQAALRKHWLAEGIRYFKDGKPEKAIATLYNLMSSPPADPEDQAGQAAYGTAVYYSGLAYAALGDLDSAWECHSIVQELNLPNKEIVEDLRVAIEKS
jgi:tetratricopeptide (TPR) repeat protein